MATATELDTDAARAHGWIDSERLQTACGEVRFVGGYPTADGARRLLELRTLNRAIEVYLSQMPAASWYAVWRAIAEAGDATPNQLVLWQSRMDAETLLLTGNAETVYGLVSLDLKRDGPVVIEAPPRMLGGIVDMWQRETAGIGPTGIDSGKGGAFLLVPPGYQGDAPDRYVVIRSHTYRTSIGVRGFLVDGEADEPAALLASMKVYPLSEAARAPATKVVKGSGLPIDTIFSDTLQFFEDLAEVVEYEPEDVLEAHERFQLASIGIVKGKLFAPDGARIRILSQAAQLGSAMARANSFASMEEERLAYPNRRWEWAFAGGSATWDEAGFVNVDHRASFAYLAIGMSPAMVNKVVGQGSQYLLGVRDSTGALLDGGKNYHLHLPPRIPAKNFWSIVAYDAVSRSMLKNEQPFPSVSSYTDPATNPDGSFDIYFGPEPQRGGNKNWIRTLDGRGWFALLRFYGPLESFFDLTWQPDDIKVV
ncbi:MAG TPA: DUF1254 domain-containing protein [Gemmatimonadaceae bacterium]|jgi:hypothetical protein